MNRFNRLVNTYKQQIIPGGEEAGESGVWTGEPYIGSINTSIFTDLILDENGVLSAKYNKAGTYAPLNININSFEQGSFIEFSIISTGANKENYNAPWLIYNLPMLGAVPHTENSPPEWGFSVRLNNKSFKFNNFDKLSEERWYIKIARDRDGGYYTLYFAGEDKIYDSYLIDYNLDIGAVGDLEFYLRDSSYYTSRGNTIKLDLKAIKIKIGNEIIWQGVK